MIDAEYITRHKQGNKCEMIIRSGIKRFRVKIPPSHFGAKPK